MLHCIEWFFKILHCINIAENPAIAVAIASCNCENYILAIAKLKISAIAEFSSFAIAELSNCWETENCLAS